MIHGSSRIYYNWLDNIFCFHEKTFTSSQVIKESIAPHFLMLSVKAKLHPGQV